MDHLLKNCNMNHHSWKHWHAGMTHGKAMAVAIAHGMHLECCKGNLQPEWKTEPVTFCRFRETLARQMLNCSPTNRCCPMSAPKQVFGAPLDSGFNRNLWSRWSRTEPGSADMQRMSSVHTRMHSQCSVAGLHQTPLSALHMWKPRFSSSGNTFARCVLHAAPDPFRPSRCSAAVPPDVLGACKITGRQNDSPCLLYTSDAADE